MILKRKKLALSLTLFTLLFLSPFITKSQNTLPTTTVTGCLKVDSTMSTGNLESTGHLEVGGSGRIDSSLVVGDTMRAQDVIVTGNARIAGDLNVGGNLVFKNGTGIGVTPGATLGSEVFSYGRSGTGILPTLNPCFNPNPPFTTHQFGGVFQVYDNGPSGYTGGSILTMQSWFNGSSIDVAGQSSLLMNYFCGKNIIMCTGSNGGIVFVGDKFQARKNVQIGQHNTPVDPNVALNMYDITNEGIKLWPANPSIKLIHDHLDQFMVMGNGKTSIGVNSTPGTTPYRTLTVNGDASFANYGAADGANAFEILGNNQKPTGRGISVDNNTSGNINFFINSTTAAGSFKFKNGTGPTYDLMELDLLGKLALTSYGIDAFTIKNFGTGKIGFIVKANGTTYIGDKVPITTGPHGNAKLAVDGKILAKEIYVNIHNSVWPDYVFEKNYALTPLKEVEAYYIKNNHLKDVPSAKEINENGINTSEMFTVLLQKIEDLTLYTVAQDKRIEKLEKEKEEMKAQLRTNQKN